MKLDFNFQVKALDGKDIQGEGGSAGKILGGFLSAQNKGNSIKLYDWALKTWNATPLEIDDTDADVLIGLIETTEMLTVLAKVPLMEYIKSVKAKK